MKCSIIILLFLSSVCFAQKTNEPLKNTIDRFSAQTAERLTASEKNGEYKIKDAKIYYLDFDEDGDFDGVTEILFCERKDCNPATQVSKLAVFLVQDREPTFVIEETYRPYAKINLIKHGSVTVDIYGFDKDDPQRRPAVQRRETYVLRAGSLVKSK